MILSFGCFCSKATRCLRQRNPSSHGANTMNSGLRWIYLKGIWKSGWNIVDGTDTDYNWNHVKGDWCMHRLML